MKTVAHAELDALLRVHEKPYEDEGCLRLTPSQEQSGVIGAIAFVCFGVGMLILGICSLLGITP